MKKYICGGCGSEMKPKVFADCIKAICPKCNRYLYIPDNPKFMKNIVKKG